MKKCGFSCIYIRFLSILYYREFEGVLKTGNDSFSKLKFIQGYRLLKMVRLFHCWLNKRTILY
jgi:hypothetical protein